MKNKHLLVKILFVIGNALIAIGLIMSQIRIPLTKTESESLFKNCADCKTPPTYRNIDPNISYAIIFTGIPITCAAAVVRFVM